jgi:hypothetical protein
MRDECGAMRSRLTPRYRREKEQELAQKQALQQEDEQKRGAQRRAEILKFLQQVMLRVHM